MKCVEGSSSHRDVSRHAALLSCDACVYSRLERCGVAIRQSRQPSIDNQKFSSRNRPKIRSNGMWEFPDADVWSGKGLKQSKFSAAS
eukprot:1679597-Rhodomonas_salina.2